MYKACYNLHAPRDNVVHATRLHITAEFREVEDVVHRFDKRCPACLDGMQERSLAVA